MRISEQIEQLKKALSDYMSLRPQFQREIEEILKVLEQDSVNTNAFREIYSRHKQLIRQAVQASTAGSAKECGRVFDVYKEYPLDIRQRLKLADTESHYKNWAETVKALPKKTKPLPIVDKEFLDTAKMKWKKNVFGNEEILQILLRHTVEYSRTGRTTPILLLGPPGVGKTLIAKNYGSVMNLPYSFISGPSASVNRGLAGAPNLYSGAGAGAIAQAMITNQVGNPVICIDEIEKAVGGYYGNPGFQDELLAAMDDSNSHWHDNYIEMDLDASHVPYVFTTNSQEKLSAPLLDRMEIIELKPLQKEDIFHIVKDITIPNTLKAYGSEEICFEEREAERLAELLVELLWKNRNISCRPYQKAVETLLSDAYLDTIETGKAVRINENRVRKTVEKSMVKTVSNPIGFRN